jgi:hypothetical protein
MKLRLGPLPSTQVIKMTIAVPRELKENLDRYAEMHSSVWNEPVDVATLVPHMLSVFIAHDREFRRALRRGGGGPSGSAKES